MGCPELDHVSLAGPQLQVEFFEEVDRGLAGVAPLPQRACWSLEWTWEVDARVASAGCVDLLARVGASFVRRGGSFRVLADPVTPPDLRLTCEGAAAQDQRPTAGLSTFGEGMEWFLGGVPPAGLTTEQHAVISNRYAYNSR
ncbi:unnamed protein product [Prorocentrum cordatum]|uniref:Beta-galactosidase n=1 Tax=Prorocentrum cordatum TaxID=2364126 RepID=A0ABN9W8A8_9DINO|nr:unnamed protein product [Polarella glacialis]